MVITVGTWNASENEAARTQKQMQGRRRNISEDRGRNAHATHRCDGQKGKRRKRESGYEECTARAVKRRVQSCVNPTDLTRNLIKIIFAVSVKNAVSRTFAPSASSYGVTRHN